MWPVTEGCVARHNPRDNSAKSNTTFVWITLLAGLIPKGIKAGLASSIKYGSNAGETGLPPPRFRRYLETVSRLGGGK